MNLEKIKNFIKLAKSEGVSELKYEEKDLKISVNFSVGQSIVQAPMTSHAPSLAVSPVGESIESFHEIKSPFVGTFYARPSPGKPIFVKTGDKISSGQTLCILEAMKIMNEIESDITGEIVEVCVENESLVEFGQVLFKVRR